MGEFWEYIETQINLIPQTVYEVLLSLLVVGAMVILLLYRKNTIRYMARLILSEYLFIVYGITVFFRMANRAYSRFLTPFWSYKEIVSGEAPSLINEIIMNVVLFIPIGLLWGAQSNAKPSQQQWLFAFVLGIGLSIVIEVLQLVFKKGSFEIDDIIHNTAGCMLGYAAWRGCEKLVEAIKSKKKH